MRLAAERRRELWLEPLPAAELASILRRLPLFASVSVDELFRIAGASRQIRHESGTTLLQEGAVPEQTHLLLDGRVTATSRDGAPRTIDAPAPLGFAEALQGKPMRESVRTTGLAVTLALTAEELRTLLADSTDLIAGLFATIVDRVGDTYTVLATGAAPEFERLADGGITPVEKVLALQRVPLFARVSASEMPQLAAIAETTPMSAGSSLFDASAPAALWLLLTGEVSLDNGQGTPLVARGGDVFGALPTIAGRPFGRSAAVTRSGVALRIGHDPLFDVLSANGELLRQIFAGTFHLEGTAVVAGRV
jgi:CRP-like cAMP-binding protein